MDALKPVRVTICSDAQCPPSPLSAVSALLRCAASCRGVSPLSHHAIDLGCTEIAGVLPEEHQSSGRGIAGSRSSLALSVVTMLQW